MVHIEGSRHSLYGGAGYTQTSMKLKLALRLESRGGLVAKCVSSEYCEHLGLTPRTQTKVLCMIVLVCNPSAREAG